MLRSVKLLRLGKGIKKMMTHKATTQLTGKVNGANTATGGGVMCTTTSL